MSKEKLSKEEKKAAKAAKKAEGGNPDVKKAVIQGVAALLCVGIVAFGANSVTDKLTANKLEVAEASGAAGTSDEQGTAGTDDIFGGEDTDSAVADDTTADVSDDTAADDTAAEDTAAADDTSTDSSSSDTAAEAKSDKGSTESKSLSTAEILKIYNDATKKAADKKVAFSKSRTTVEKKYEAGVALKTFKSLVFQFMGVGDDNKFSKDVTSADADSYYKYFLASSLTSSDVTKVDINDKGSTYVIQINLKDGSSAVTDGKVTQNSKTALDKSGVACGENDKDYWDHKTAQNIYAAIDDVPGCKSATIKEKYSGAVVTMEVTKDGKIKTFTAKFTFHVDIDGVMGSSGVAEAASTLTMNNFKY